ncbi:MAG: hypothetical protein ABI859_17930 [Pseudomonadota bacterium]
MKPEKFASLNEYRPQACAANAFSVEVEFTVSAKGRASDIGLLRPKVLPPEKRQCVADVVSAWLSSTARFSKPQASCRYRLRVTTTQPAAAP